LRTGGLFAILSAKLLGAGRVLAVDGLEDRLQMARRAGAEVIDFEAEDPVEALQRLTGGIGPDRVIDAVGVDATSPESRASDDVDFEAERDQVAPERNPQGENWIAGDAPSQALRWAVEAVAKGRDDLDHRGLPAADGVVPDRGGDEQEPDDQDGQLQPP